MKRLSGEFLSRIVWALQQCNASEMSRDDLQRSVLAAFDVEDVYVDIPDADAARPLPPVVRHVAFDSHNLQRLNVMLPWSSFAPAGPQTYLGSAWSSRKRHAPAMQPDSQVRNLNNRLPLAGLSALELGCFEGHHSLSLASFGARVWAIDGRIENVVKTMVRVWMAGAEALVTTELVDLERATLKEQLAALGREEPFDLIHHRGVLYHLSDPVGNLVQCGEVCKQHLYLHTQIADDSQVTSQVQHAGRSYDVYRYKEPKTEYAPFAGITDYAQWLTEASLQRLLKDIGFERIDVIRREQERNGLRIELLASR